MLSFSNKIVFLSLKIVYVLVNSVDPDEVLHHVAKRGGSPWPVLFAENKHNIQGLNYMIWQLLPVSP